MVNGLMHPAEVLVTSSHVVQATVSGDAARRIPALQPHQQHVRKETWYLHSWSDQSNSTHTYHRKKRRTLQIQARVTRALLLVVLSEES